MRLSPFNSNPIVRQYCPIINRKVILIYFNSSNNISLKYTKYQGGHYIITKNLLIESWVDIHLDK